LNGLLIKEGKKTSEKLWLLIYFIPLRATLVDVFSPLCYRYLNTLHVLVQMAIFKGTICFEDLFRVTATAAQIVNLKMTN
jgi:hypothetical protein